MPRTGTPSSNNLASQRGEPSSLTLHGPPDKMIPAKLWLASSSIAAYQAAN